MCVWHVDVFVMSRFHHVKEWRVNSQSLASCCQSAQTPASNPLIKLLQEKLSSSSLHSLLDPSVWLHDDEASQLLHELLSCYLVESCVWLSLRFITSCCFLSFCLLQHLVHLLLKLLFHRLHWLNSTKSKLLSVSNKTGFGLLKVSQLSFSSGFNFK